MDADTFLVSFLVSFRMKWSRSTLLEDREASSLDDREALSWGGNLGKSINFPQINSDKFTKARLNWMDTDLFTYYHSFLVSFRAKRGISVKLALLHACRKPFAHSGWY